MKNTDVFNQYDMVVSITQQTINDQLTHLVKLGVIRNEFILVQEIDGNNYDYQVLDSPNQIPRNPDGTPKFAYIDGQIVPQINISESGSLISFVLNFPAGTAYFWVGNGPLAKLTRYDMAGWSYGLAITLDLKSVEKDDIGKGIKVPDLVEQQLYHFMDNMFSVNHLFMDFNSTDLLRFDPTLSNAGDSGDIGLKQLAEFMQFYLTDLVKNGNPYILGYTLSATDQSKYPQNENVPPALQPAGTTYSMYHDPTNAALSNLNFVLATRGGHGNIAGTPGTFDSNWIGANEQIDAKMIYSHSVLVEKFILEPFFDQLRTQIYDQIRDHISVSQGNGYDSAKSVIDGGFSYTINNINSGDDQYVNTYSVKLNNGGTQITLAFNGHLYIYKHVSKDMGLCTARAHGSVSVDWSGTVTIATAKDAQGEPQLTINNSFKIDSYKPDHDQNECAKFWSFIGEFLGWFLEFLTFFQDNGQLLKLLEDAFTIDVNNIGDIGTVLGNLGNSIGSVVLLPAGQEFFFKNPAADSDANLYLGLTYKSEN